MLLRKKKQETQKYDRESLYPVIRSSICTGEKVAGFKDKHNGKFIDIMLIQTDDDMKVFLETYELSEGEVKIEY